jgi:methylmalonyl-CoA mutase C-terminal domain/subunit
VVALSSLSGAHMQHLPSVARLLREKGAGDKLLIAGGVIPEDEVAELKRLGFAEIFTMGAKTSAICRYVSDWWEARS